MVRVVFTIIAALSAALSATFLVLWVLEVNVWWQAGEPQWWFAFEVAHGDMTPDLRVGLRPLFFFDVPIVFPMAVLLVLPALWGVLFFLRRRRTGTRGFPVDERDSAAAK